MPSKYRSTERRKERCRNAARVRRTKEADIFTEIEQSIPLSRQQLQQLDKISVMRVFTNTLKLRILFKNLRDAEHTDHDREFAEALDSFVLLLDNDGTVVYVSNNISKHLGIPAVDLHGSSIYQYAHPCDHNDIQELLAACSHADDHHGDKEFFIRLKCALSAAGRNVNVSSTSLYKVVKCTCRVQTEDNSKLNLNVSTENAPLQCMIVIGSVILQDTEISIDNCTFVSQHSITMKFTEVDENVTKLLGYKPSELYNKSVFEFHHAADSAASDKAYSHLFSKGQTETLLYRFLAKGGGYVWMKTQATTVCDKHSQRPQSVMCVNYVISGIEEPHLVMAEHQVSNAEKSPQEDNIEELAMGSTSASASCKRPLFPTPTKVHHKFGTIAAGGSRPSGPSVAGVKRHRPAILGYKGPSGTLQRAAPKRKTAYPATNTPDTDTTLLSTTTGDSDKLLGTVDPLLSGETDLTGLDECLVETLRLFDGNASIPSGPLDVVNFPVEPRDTRRASSTSTATASSVTPSSTEDDYDNPYTSDGFDVEDGLAAVYEDLVLSDVLLGDCNVLGIDSESDAIQRMTDTVFNNSDDESLLPELKPEFLDFVTQDKVGGKRRNLSVDSAFSPSPFKRPCTDTDNTLTTTSSPSSILMNLLTTGEGAHYQLRKKRHSHPQSSKDLSVILQANIPTAAEGSGVTGHLNTPLKAMPTHCIAKSPVAKNRGFNILKGNGKTTALSPTTSNSQVLNQKRGNTTCTVTRATCKSPQQSFAKQPDHFNAQSTMTSPVAKQLLATIQQTTPGPKTQVLPTATVLCCGTNDNIDTVAKATADVSTTPSQMLSWPPQIVTGTQNVIPQLSPRTNINATNVEQQQQQQQQQQDSSVDHPYFNRGSNATPPVPSPVETVTVRSEEELPVLSVAERRISLPEICEHSGFASTSVSALSSPLTTSPVPTSPTPGVGMQPSIGSIQVIGDSTALRSGSVQIQNFSPETVNELTSGNQNLTTSGPDYYLISAQRLQELLIAANLQKNGFKK